MRTIQVIILLMLATFCVAQEDAMSSIEDIQVEYFYPKDVSESRSNLEEKIFTFLNIYEKQKLSTAIKSELMTSLVYPEVLLDYEIQGKVVVQFDIDEQGKPHSAEIVKSLHEILDATVLEALTKVDIKSLSSFKKRPYHKMQLAIFFDVK